MKPFRVLRHANYRYHLLDGWIDGKQVLIDRDDIICSIKDSDDTVIIETEEFFLLVTPPTQLNIEDKK